MSNRRHNTRYDWAVYKRPCPDIPSSVDIGMRFVTARATPKLILATAIAFLTMSALSTCSAGVAGIDRYKKYSGEKRLVLQKQPKLGERPGVQNRTLLPPGLNPFANSSQVLDGQSALGAFSFGNDLLADNVIGMRGESSLTPGKALQFSLGGSTAVLLKVCPQSAMPMSNILYFGTRAPQAVGIGSDVRDAEIYPEEVGRLYWCAGGEFDGAVQVELSLAVNEVALPLDSVEPLFLILSIDQRHDDAARRECPKTHLVESLESENPFVVCDRPVWLEGRTLGLIAPKAFNGFSEARADLGVCQFVDRRLAEGDCGESPASRERGGFVDTLHGRQQKLALPWIGYQLQLQGELHYSGVYHSYRPEATAKSSPAKAGGIEPGDLT
jgi:hypothetical protein